MHKGIGLGEHLLVYPLYIGQGAANDVSAFVDVSKAQHVTFFITIDTNDTATTFAVEASSATTTNASCNQIAFQYRVSGAATTAAGGADTWLAITTADSGGFALAEGDSNRAIIIDVDPAVVAEGSSTHRYLRVITAATAYGTAPGLAITAFLEPRYSNSAYTT